MRPSFRFAAVLALVALTAAPAGAQSDRCTRDALVVDGVPVRASFCVAADASAPITVSETFSAAGKTITKATAIDILPGALISRTIDDVDLAALGVKRSLHMTLAYHAGVVTLEHALAIPGATPLK